MLCTNKTFRLNSFLINNNEPYNKMDYFKVRELCCIFKLYLIVLRLFDSISFDLVKKLLKNLNYLLNVTARI